MQRLLLVVLLAALTAPLSRAQIRKAPLSPRSVVKQEVGLVNVTLDYSRPGVKGRKIFGELEPFGKVWRTGANASSKITFEGDVSFGGEAVPAGTYGLYTIPEAKQWTVILHKRADLWGAGGYDPAQDLLRVQVPVLPRKDLQESLRIGFDTFHANGADLVITWEHTQVRVPVFVDSDAEVLAQIDERVRQAQGEVSAQSYFDAGMFLYEKGQSLDEAEAWIDKAVELRPSAFWQVYYQAELAAQRGKLDKARASAATALRLAQESRAGDFGYATKAKLLLARLEER